MLLSLDPTAFYFLWLNCYKIKKNIKTNWPQEQIKCKRQRKLLLPVMPTLLMNTSVETEWMKGGKEGSAGKSVGREKMAREGSNSRRSKIQRVIIKLVTISLSVMLRLVIFTHL